jgi:GLPGLI family protein
MKQFFLVTCLAAFFITNAQTKKGTIVFERKVDIHRRMEDEQMKVMTPQFQTTKTELIFNDNVSIYKDLPADNAPDPFDNGSGARVMIKIGGPGENNILYKDYSGKKIVEQTDLADKTYLIDDTIKISAWKLTDETKMVINHVCKKATMKNERGSDVVAWYAEDVPVPVGPESYGGLPGAILLLDINSGEIVYTATNLNDDAKELQEPTKGKHITRADFDKKLDELFGPASKDGKRVIKMTN